jgi:hypothetical protein
MCGPVIPPRKRLNVLGAEKYFSNIVSPRGLGEMAETTVAGGSIFMVS